MIKPLKQTYRAGYIEKQVTLDDGTILNYAEGPDHGPALLLIHGQSMQWKIMLEYFRSSLNIIMYMQLIVTGMESPVMMLQSIRLLLWERILFGLLIMS